MIIATLTLAFAAVVASPAPVAVPSESEFDYLSVSSKHVKRSVGVGVYLPPGYEESADRRYPVLYFLHGMFGNERKWESRGCPEILDRLISSGDAEPMIVVAPAGYNGFWINWVNGKADWHDFLLKELVPQIDEQFRTVATPAGRGITGDSMGGYGALNLAFQRPDIFGSVSAHSAMIYPVELDNLPGWVQENMDRWSPIFGDPVDMDHWKSNHPLHLARTVDTDALARLKIYFDCGKSDRFEFDVGARDLHEALEKRDVEHEYYLRDGNHGRSYFTRYVPESLGFHGRVFKELKEQATSRDV